MDDSERKKIVSIICIVVFILFMVMCSKSLFKEEQKKNKKTEEKKIVDLYENYNIGDKVSLMDGSKYTVIEDSKSDKKSVLILSDININKWNFKNSEATYFLNKEFRDELVSKLRVPIDEIDEIRLLSIDDISNIIGVDNNKIESGLKIKDDYKFLYEGETITSGRSVNGVLKLGKEADTGLGIVGEDKPDNVSSVRVVIRLPKFFVTLN